MIDTIYDVVEFRPLQSIIEQYVKTCSPKLISKYGGNIEFIKYLCQIRNVAFHNDVGYLEINIPRYVTDYRYNGDNFKLFKQCYELFNKLKL